MNKIKLFNWIHFSVYLDLIGLKAEDQIIQIKWMNQNLPINSTAPSLAADRDTHTHTHTHKHNLT